LWHGAPRSTFGLVFVRRVLLTAAVALLALALAPVSGHAAAKLKYHACDGKKYQLLVGSPGVKLLRIKMRNRKADGYAPRCLVAEAVAMNVVGPGDKPAKIDVYGARWNGGTYRRTYAEKSGYTQVQCRHTGKDAATVRFRLT
jgi:hypothetical protein